MYTKKLEPKSSNAYIKRTLFEGNIPIRDFYNEDLKKKIYKIYKSDFKMFERYGLNYDI